MVIGRINLVQYYLFLSSKMISGALLAPLISELSDGCDSYIPSAHLVTVQQ